MFFDISSFAFFSGAQMTVEEKDKYHNFVWYHINQHTSIDWCNSFCQKLERTATSSNVPIMAESLDTQKLVDAFRNSKKRLILTGLEGTLTRNSANGVANTVRFE